MNIALGIDTGGTNTDAALIDQESGKVLAGAKSLTTRHDLSLGITGAMEEVLSHDSRYSVSDISLVGLSTTLATNAIVEGQGHSVCLLLVGYDPGLIRKYGFEDDLVTPDIVHIAGGHDAEGNEAVPLDEEAIGEAVAARKDDVDAFAVSSYFSVRNPEHELRVRKIVDDLTAAAGRSTPVTCGHELTSRLDAIRRATTTALNAKLIPLLQELITTVRSILDEHNIDAPLMIVKGDGSLVKSDWAIGRPIETILSGPAASLIGAWHLAGRGDVWVVDVGGTTSDIAALSDGRPRLHPEGAQVGGWRTMIETADIQTVGLGGDSQVALNSASLTIGPRRVIPLCLLANQHPQILTQLHRQVRDREHPELAGRFVQSQRLPSRSLSRNESELLQHLNSGPRSLIDLASDMPYGVLDVRQMREAESQRLILLSAFTPTDALHVLERFQQWNTEAARMGAEILAAQMNLSIELFCKQVVQEVSNKLTSELVNKVLDTGNEESNGSSMPLLRVATGEHTDLACQLTLSRPIVAVGAPVDAYLPRTSEQLNTELIIPPNAHVANAVGAVSGGVVQTITALVRPIDALKPIRLHLPEGTSDFKTVQEAVDFARERVPDQLQDQAHQAGADHVEIRVHQDDRTAPVGTGWEETVFVETILTFTAIGRPGPGN